MKEAKREVHVIVPYVDDKELRVTTVESPAGVPFVDLREYIPSLGEYGRGITFPSGLLHEVMEGFESVWHSHGSGAEGTPTEPPQ